MKNRFFLHSISIIFLVFFNLACGQKYSGKEAPVAKNGVLDLSDWNFEKDGPVELNGNWHFYWKKHLNLSDLVSTKELPSLTGSYFSMPQTWNGHKNPTDENKVIESEGYASFVLKIKLPSKSQGLSLKIHEILSSYELLLVKQNNLVKILAAGQIASSKKEQIPESIPKISHPIDHHLDHYKREITILLKVSNFYSYQAGLNSPIKLGKHKALDKELSKEKFTANGLIGLLLIMGFYHLGLFIQRKQDKASFFFGLTCFSVALRQVCMEKLLFYFEISKTSLFFEWHYKLEYLSMYLIAFFFVSFLYYLIPAFWFLISKKILMIITLFYTFLTLSSSLIFYSSWPLLIYQLIVFLFILLTIIHLIKESLHGEKAAQYSLLGFIPFLLTIINDILFQQNIIDSFALTPYGFAVFILAQSYILSKVFTDAFKKAEDLSENLQARVEERTAALAQKTEEAISEKQKAEKASEALELANKKLEKMDLQKTAFFQNITHEFRTPLNLITGPLETEILLRRDLDFETLKNKNSQILSNARRLLRLINQLLDLSKSDAGRLKLEVRSGYLNEFIESLFLSFNELAKSKKIKLRFQSPPKMVNCFFDKEKIEKVIINLLSNAIKFTPDHGIIELKINERSKKEGESASFDRDLLIVDDEEIVAFKLLSHIRSFEIENFSFEDARNAKEAKELLKKFRFKLIISDLSMPGEDGISFLKYCQENYPNSERVLITSHDDKDTVKRAINEAKIQSFLSKPWSSNELEKILIPIFKTDDDLRWVEIEIKDSGIGISKEDLPHIFDRFTQADSADKVSQAGTGIGLALVKDLIKLHRGQIEVKSESGKGTKFKIILPATEKQYAESEILKSYETEDDEKNYSAEVEIAGIEHLEEKNKHSKRKYEQGRPLILLAEDNISMRDYIATVLEDFFNLDEAGDGIEAIRYLENKIPDLIISDINMPNMDGEELLERLKEHKTWSKIPFIHLTAKGSEDQKLSGLEAGADDYLAKPFNPKELVMRVKNLLRLKAMEKELTENVLKKYLAPDLVDQIISGDIDFLAEPKQMDITVLFSDLSGFTRLSSNKTELQISEILNDYLKSMNEIIFSAGGTIDKFMGDGIMVLFGAPIEIPRLRQIEAATECAFLMNSELEKLNGRWINKKLITKEESLKMRIGIHAGPALVGNFGSEMRSDFTAIGNNVNLAARIEGVCKPDSIFCSRQVTELLKPSQFKSEGLFELKGLSGETELFSLNIENL